MGPYLMLYIRLSTGYTVISQKMLDDNPNWLDIYRNENGAENVDLFWKPVMILAR